MKMMNIGLALVVVGLGVAAQAGTVVHNKTTYKIKVVAEVASLDGWIAYPDGSVRKENGQYILNDNTPGIEPGQSASSGRDASYIKTNWIVWATDTEGNWQKAPVITSGQRGFGGIIEPVNTDVYSYVGEGGRPAFSINVHSGW
jgi:hypothetical protein